MVDKLASALAFDRQALRLRSLRQKVIASNIANADTPNYKARDFNFTQALKQATGAGQTTVQQPLPMRRDDSRQLAGQQTTGALPVQLMYRVPAQPSLDGNTVNMDAARVAFADNTVHYEASLSLVNSNLQRLKAAMAPGS